MRFRVNTGLPRHTGWRFEEPWELMAGRWVIQVLDEDHLLAEQAFTIVPWSRPLPSRSRAGPRLES